MLSEQVNPDNMRYILEVDTGCKYFCDPLDLVYSLHEEFKQVVSVGRKNTMEYVRCIFFQSTSPRSNYKIEKMIATLYDDKLKLEFNYSDSVSVNMSLVFNSDSGFQINHCHSENGSIDRKAKERAEDILKYSTLRSKYKINYETTNEPI